MPDENRLPHGLPLHALRRTVNGLLGRPTFARRRAGSAMAAVAIASFVSATWAAPAGPPAVNSAVAITVESDRMQYDDRQQTNVFKGNVVLVRGDIEIRADELVVHQNAKGEQTATASGKPATFVQRRPGAGDVAQGSGSELRFNDKTQELEIVGGATLLRQRPGQVADSVTGTRIVYQSTNDFFTVYGDKNGGTADNPRGRVRVVIQPRSEAGPGNGTQKGKTPENGAKPPISKAPLTPAPALGTSAAREP